jgi:hypothetical protein
MAITFYSVRELLKAIVKSIKENPARYTVDIILGASTIFLQPS